VKRLLRILPPIILVAGLVVSYVSYQRIYDRSLLATEGVVAAGVVKWASTTGGQSNQSYRISVSYLDSNRHEWTRYFTVFSSQYRAGQSVTVTYLPANPDVALLGSNESGETHVHDVIAAVIGVIAVVVGGIMTLAIYMRHAATSKSVDANNQR
jgi:hypothetical protein